ncbi:hypothetical protein BGZ73_009151, partial [Actinomortierella ambigua]
MSTEMCAVGHLVNMVLSLARSLSKFVSLIITKYLLKIPAYQSTLYERHTKEYFSSDTIVYETLRAISGFRDALSFDLEESTTSTTTSALPPLTRQR